VSLPKALIDCPQWLVSGPDKAPRSVHTGVYADVRDPNAYTGYQEAFEYASVRGWNVGFALRAEDGFAVIDLDEPDTPEQAERHSKLIDAFHSYTELSRSEQGAHIWLRGNVARGVRRSKVELYSEARYMICTGNTIRDLPIAEGGELLAALFTEMGGQDEQSESELVEVGEVKSDMVVIDMASRAVNGDKFDMLCRGEWELYYTSQSEADYALMNMLAFYSASNEQCRRLFRYSGLGKRAKAQRDKYLNYMLTKIRSEEPEPVDLSVLVERVADSKREGVAEDADVWDRRLPPGLVGRLSQYITESAPRPVKEVGIVAALSMSAGIMGRQFNVSGTGLNLYCILLAKTGTGKEGGASGIERLLHEVRQKVPSVEVFLGPGTFASGQAIIRALDEKPSFFSVLGEFGLTLQMMSDPRAGSHLVVMRRVLLDLYGKSGKTSVLYSTAYSDKEKNTKMLTAPAMTMFGESTPDSFYAGLSESQIADGLIPRFLIMEYHGSRTARNDMAFASPDEALVDELCERVVTALQMMSNNVFMDVQIGPDATALYDKFDQECDNHINAGGDEATRQMWNRAHLKALKIGGVLAAMDRPHKPVINAEEAQWAIDVVMTDLIGLNARFERGDVGEGDSKQYSDLVRVLAQYRKWDYETLSKYRVPRQLHRVGVVPFTYLQRRVAGLSAFKKSRVGSRSALASVVKEAVDTGLLVQVSAKQLQIEMDVGERKWSGRFYKIRDKMLK